MASVFGKEDEKEAKRNSMRVNPLYDQDGSVTVSSTEAQRARSSSTTSDGAAEETERKSNKPFKKSKRRSVPDDESENNVPEPKIAYSKNFRFKGPKQNGTANGHAGQKKIVSLILHYQWLYHCIIKISILVRYSRKSHKKNAWKVLVTKSSSPFGIFDEFNKVDLRYHFAFVIPSEKYFWYFLVYIIDIFREKIRMRVVIGNCLIPYHSFEEVLALSYWISRSR